MRAIASLASSPACLAAAMPSDAAFCSARRRSAAAVASRQLASSSSQLVDALGQLGRAPRQRGADRVGVAADEPEVQHRPGRYLLPAYLERKAATSSASFPTTMFSGMIAPEKPPLRSA